MSKIYSLYGKDERTIDNLKRRIRGYEKMKVDITSQNRKLYKENKKLKEENQKYKEVIDKTIHLLDQFDAWLEPQDFLKIKKIEEVLKEVE